MICPGRQAKFMTVAGGSQRLTGGRFCLRRAMPGRCLPVEARHGCVYLAEADPLPRPDGAHGHRSSLALRRLPKPAHLTFPIDSES